ncbi:insulinase family protein [Bacteriovoracaceae bacterium]|nr:insulinase family protein [Bacteriovoracaceae bacterium]
MRFKIVVMLAQLILVGCSHLEKNPSAVSKSDKNSTFSIRAPKLKVEKIILSNGLTVLLVENHRLPVFGYYTFYNVGSKNEPKGMSGVTHYLEHMMFKGAKKYGPGKFDVNVESRGGSSNAYTTFDLTVYHELMPKNALNLIIDMEADRMMNVALEKKSFDKEKHIILEERKLRYENSPQGKLLLTMTKNIYKKTPYEEAIIGRKKDIKNYTVKGVREYFKKYYAPNNAILVIVGDIDTDETIEKIKTAYSTIPRSDLIRSNVVNKKEYIVIKPRGISKKINGRSRNVKFMLAQSGGAIGTKEAYLRDILGIILGGGESSYLVQKYVNSKRPLLTNIYAYNYGLHHSGIFLVGGEVLYGKHYKTFLKQFKKDRKNMCKKAVNSRNLQKAKNHYFVEYFSALETNAGIASFLGEQELVFGDYSHYQKEVEKYNEINLTDVQILCRKLFVKNQYDSFAVWDKYKERKL